MNVVKVCLIKSKAYPKNMPNFEDKPFKNNTVLATDSKKKTNLDI
jgi:hypothetical protein